METGGNKNDNKTPEQNQRSAPVSAPKLDRELPFVKAERLIDDRGRMEASGEFKIFPRKAWENMFKKETGKPLLPNFIGGLSNR